MDDEVARLRAQLALVEERIDRVGLRMSAGYGSDSDREGWLVWLRQLRTQRDELRQALATAGPPPDEDAQ